MLLFWECCSRALLAQVLGPSTVPVLILLQESGTNGTNGTWPPIVSSSAVQARIQQIRQETKQHIAELRQWCLGALCESVFWL